MNTVTIGCRLPNGVILHNDPERLETVKLRGFHDSDIKNADFSTTEVSADFWEFWKAQNEGHSLLTSGSVFEIASKDEGKAKMKDLRQKKTGLEPMPQEAPGIKKA